MIHEWEKYVLYQLLALLCCCSYIKRTLNFLSNILEVKCLVFCTELILCISFKCYAIWLCYLCNFLGRLQHVNKRNDTETIPIIYVTQQCVSVISWKISSCYRVQRIYAFVNSLWIVCIFMCVDLRCRDLIARSTPLTPQDGCAVLTI